MNLGRTPLRVEVVVAMLGLLEGPEPSEEVKSKARPTMTWMSTVMVPVATSLMAISTAAQTAVAMAKTPLSWKQQKATRAQTLKAHLLPAAPLPIAFSAQAPSKTTHPPVAAAVNSLHE